MSYKVVTGVAINIQFMRDILKRIGADLIQATLKTEADVIKHAADADGAIVGLEPYTKKAVEALSRCKIISRTGVGYSNIDVDAATRQGIPVALAVGSNMHEVSDYAVACILAFNRRLFPLAQAVRAGTWSGGSQAMMKFRGNMRRLNQQTLGLIGMGRIGSLVVQKVKGFGMRVLVFDPYVTADTARKLGAETADFETVLTQSDYISIHAPLTAETEHLLGLSEFKKMKPTAYLINAARGGLIDEKALHQALTEGIIAGAALDVTDPEPPDPDNPLIKLDQVLMTGHSSWYSDLSISEGQGMAAEAVVQALSGTWPSYLANPEVKQQKNARIGKER